MDNVNFDTRNINESQTIAINNNKKISISEHARTRYTERIKNINDVLLKKQFILLHKDKINEFIYKNLKYATFVYKGQIGKSHTTSNYYICDGVIFITNSDNTKLITLYKVDFDLPDKVNKYAAKELLNDIFDMQKKLEKTNEEINDFVDDKKDEIQNYKDKIIELEEQISSYKLKININEDLIKDKQKDSNLIKLKLKEYLNKLLNSKYYKNDLKTLGDKNI